MAADSRQGASHAARRKSPFSQGQNRPRRLGFWGFCVIQKSTAAAGALARPQRLPHPARARRMALFFLRANSAPRKTPLSHGFRGLAAIKAVAKKTGFAALADAKAGLPGGWRPAFRTCSKPVREGCNRQSGKACAGRRWRLACAGCALNAPWACPGCVPQAARITPFLRANSRPRKRLYRTVLRAWLLSKRERKKLVFGRIQPWRGKQKGA